MSGISLFSLSLFLFLFESQAVPMFPLCLCTFHIVWVGGEWPGKGMGQERGGFGSYSSSTVATLY